MRQPTRIRQHGFTSIELVLIAVVICVLLALVVTTRAGVRQNERNTERQRDVKELRNGLEAYFAQYNRYPTLKDVNDPRWRDTNMKPIGGDVFRDPSGMDDRLADKPAQRVYAYTATTASGTACNEKDPCTQYSLTATLEGGGSYVKNSLN
jgi:type II secretory pathway pseudopilin PulG